MVIPFFCVKGPNMIKIKKKSEELTKWLKSYFDKGKYKDIYYGIWFR